MSSWRRQNAAKHLKASFLKLQDGRCAICNTDDFGKRSSQLDHDHKRGTFRGVLCFRCNVGLGAFCDSQELLTAAISYLKTSLSRVPRYPRWRLRTDKDRTPRQLAAAKRAQRIMVSLPKTEKQKRNWRRAIHKGHRMSRTKAQLKHSFENLKLMGEI
jgi:Recombination endonuclease VII